MQSNGSKRFYNEVHSVEDTNFQKKESSSKLHQNESEYTQKEYEYNENPQEYSQPSQEQNQPQQQEQMYVQSEFGDQRQYEQSGDIYGTDEYNTQKYIDQQNYDSSRYGTNALQSTNEYDYQGFSQSGDGQPLESLYQSEQYSEQYQNEDPSAEFSTAQNQPIQQSLTEPTSSATNVQRYKANGNNTNTPAQRQTIPKQSTKKKFT